MAENNKDLGFSFMDNFSCKICLEVLHDPVQCQTNEHYFCRKCITKHLGNSQTCPLCMDQLTLETLRPPSRIILEIVSQIKKPRCSHVSRGCEENVKVEELLLHEQTCGYAPVVCSNEGCKETVNRRDKESHETEECKFRKITCESCAEEMVYVDYGKHQCTLRKEINEIKLQLNEMNDALKQMSETQTQVLEKLRAYDQSIKDIQDPLRHASSMTTQREGTVVVNGQIFIFGGNDGLTMSETYQSLDVFNWSTKTWTLVKNCLFFRRYNSFSFVYEKKIMVCGGVERIEYLNPSESGYTSIVSSVSLPSNAQHNGLRYGNRILTFNKGVVEISLETPGESRTIIEEEQGRYKSAGVHCFGNDIYIVGGQESKMEKYDVAKNELKTLPSLPYTVINMASVAYKDNIIMLGGYDGNKSLKDVVMFNVTTQEYKRLPSMLEKRDCFAAVVMSDVIVVMGGQSTENYYKLPNNIKSVEYYVIGHNAWQELPAMNVPRYGATACVYV